MKITKLYLLVSIVALSAVFTIFSINIAEAADPNQPGKVLQPVVKQPVKQVNPILKGHLPKFPTPGPAPKIDRVTPIDPDNYPRQSMGKEFTIFGSNFAGSNKENYIEICNNSDPPYWPSSGPNNCTEVHPRVAGTSTLYVPIPLNLPKAPGWHYLWVGTSKGGWSNYIEVLIDAP